MRAIYSFGLFAACATFGLAVSTLPNANAQPGPTTSPKLFSLVRVLLPKAEASVWVEGQLMKSTGTERLFRSPELTPGHQYLYTFEASWQEGKRPVTRKKDVTLTAGQATEVDFTLDPLDFAIPLDFKINSQAAGYGIIIQNRNVARIEVLKNNSATPRSEDRIQPAQYDYDQGLIPLAASKSVSLGYKPVHVRGYYRSNGTYVAPHNRSLPSSRSR